MNIPKRVLISYGLTGLSGLALTLLLGGCEQQIHENSASAALRAPGLPPRLDLQRTGDATPDTPSGTVSRDGRVIQMNDDAQKESDLQYAEAGHHKVDSSVKVTGEVLANADLQTHVTTPVTGRITEINVRVGDHVVEGNCLMTIRSADIEQSEADLLQNEAQVRADLKQALLQIDSDSATAAAQIKLSESTFKRIRSLVEEKIASRADFESAKTQFEKDQISLDALNRKRDATIALSKERMDLMTEPTKTKLRLLGVTDDAINRVMTTRKVDPFLHVIAPETGIISERLVNLGELVDPTKALFTIGDYHIVWLKADVYEKDVSKIADGQPIELEVDSFPDEKFRGKLNYVSDSINPDTRTLTVRAEVPNPGLKLKPKMFARMTILVGERSALTIPIAAVQDAGTSKVVYVPRGKGVFEERKVTLGSDYGQDVEVLSGVRSGERVVTKGSFDLRSSSLRES